MMQLSYIREGCLSRLSRVQHGGLVWNLARSSRGARGVYFHSTPQRSKIVHEGTFSSFFVANDRWSPPTTNPRVLKEEEPPPAALPPLTPQEERTFDYPPQNVIYKPNPPMTALRLLKVYTALSKSRLTTLVVLTAMSGYALSPFPGSVTVLLSTAIGTALCSASANTFNQIQEVPYDAQMVRTRSRPLVRRIITPFHAFNFGLVSGIAGVGILWTCVNPFTAALGALNIVLYAGAYTALKRKHVINTWVGSLVGAIPPIMGWTACGGSLIPSLTAPIILFLPDLDPSAILPGAIDNPLAVWTLAALLFSWQFPHFNAFSLMTADSYARAGFQMLSVLNPKKNAAVSLRHAVLLSVICSVFTPLSGLTTWWFALSSLAPNAILIRAAWQFWRTNGGLSEAKARAVWRIALWWLPLILGLMMFHKKDSQWGAVRWNAEPEESTESTNREDKH